MRFTDDSEVHRQERRRLTLALLLSLLIHTLLLGLTFGGGDGLPGFGFPWRERRIEAPDLRVLIVPAQGTAVQPAGTSDNETPPEVSVRSAEVPVNATRPSVPRPVVVPAERFDGAALVVPVAPPVPAPVAVAPVISSPQPVEKPAPRVAADTAQEPGAPLVRERAVEPAELDQSELEVQRQAVQLEAERIASARLEAAREESERVESARLEAERQEAARQTAALHEAAQREATRREAQGIANARVEAERQEAERREAERQEAQRQEAERQETVVRAAAQQEALQREAARREAERIESARLEAERQEVARQLRREAARREAERIESARLEAERQEVARQLEARQEAARQEAARQEVAREEAQRIENARLEAERREVERQAAARQEAARQQAAQQEAQRMENARLEAERQEAERQATARQDAARTEAALAEARREERLRAIGRQLDEEAAKRAAASNAADLPSRLSPSSSGTRRGRLFGRVDPNAELIRYAEAWARKIELNMTFDMVRNAAKRPHTAPLVTVAIRSDGSVESVTFVMSSGVAEIDEAIRRIVESQAPYQAFPPGLSRDFDVVEIRRTWHFDVAIRLN